MTTDRKSEYHTGACWYPACSVRDANEGGTAHATSRLLDKHGGSVAELSDGARVWYGPGLDIIAVLNHSLSHERGARVIAVWNANRDLIYTSTTV